MTRVDFYSNTSDKLRLARQVAQKAWRAGHRVLVYSADSDLLDQLDQQWWGDPPAGFLPHARANAAHAGQTGIVLAEDIGDLPHCDVLINLSTDHPGFFSRFERLIEIVSLDEADRTAARERWRFYHSRGYALHNHDMTGNPT